MRLSYDQPAPNWAPDKTKCPECKAKLLKATNMGVLMVGVMYKCPNCNWMGIEIKENK